MRKILITGGLGKIGSYFTTNFHTAYDIKIADLATNDAAFPGNVTTVQADLMDYALCEKLCEGIDTVLHLAGIVDPVSESDALLETNIKTTQHLFKAAATAGCKRVIFASSAQTIESYPTDVQVTENMVVKPKNTYGVSKCFGEALAAYYAYNCDYVN